ncbi:MAG TPA: type VI secretion protein IcmF/TssM N-terminal domain-containing protein [Gammaproteobacteria bacterium]
MLKKVLKFLLWLLIFALVAAAVTGIVLYLGKTVEDALVVNGIVFGAWFLIWLIRRIYVRLRARAQAKRVINEDEPDPEAGIPTRELLRNLKARWQNAMRSLGKSQLKQHGNPVYVLPWYLVMGRPRSGKSTAMKNARLLSPLLESMDHDNGQTRNLDLWLYEDAIVIDTAGRYAVPDNAARDRLEWAALLDMLARHKEKEPLNGVVMVVAADRLLKCSEAELMEEGRQVRASLSELMTRLEVKLPVYVMITKADLLPGFTAWANHFPDEVTAQALGELLEDERGTTLERLDAALDAVITRGKELRLVLLDRKRNIDNDALSLPETLATLRRGLHAFASGALAENAYQETPYLRGLFLSSSEQAVNEKKNAPTEARGLFLKEFFTRVMPPDRDLLRTLPKAERLRRLALQYGASIGGAVVVLAFIALGGLFFTDLRALDQLHAEASPVVVNDDDVVEQFHSLTEIRALVEALEATEAAWLVPWALPGGETLALQSMKHRYARAFETGVLDALDARRRALEDELNANPDDPRRGDLLLGLVREVNLLDARLLNDAMQPPSALPAPPPEYPGLLGAGFAGDAALEFHSAFLAWLAWQDDDAVIRARRDAVRAELVAALAAAPGDIRWLVRLANRQGLDGVVLDDFWPGSKRITEAPRIDAAFTVAGHDFIQGVRAEIALALPEENANSATEENYRAAYLDAWRNFASRFDAGMQRLATRKDWIDLLNQFPLDTNPYFTLLGRMQAELAPFATAAAADPALMLVTYFNDMQNFVGAGGEGGGANKGAAAKLGLKLLGKTGKVGKAIAGVAKKGLKTAKKVQKISGKKGASKEELDTSLEQAATTLKDYKKALADAAFAADTRQVSYDTTVVAFNTPNAPESGAGPVAMAYTAINALQAIAGRPYEANELFWQLYTGPARLVQRYMAEEANCRLDETWQSAVLAEADGVRGDKLPALLIGESGLVWTYIAGPAAPFIEKRAGRGYLPRVANENEMAFTGNFLDFINDADVGRNLLGGEYVVSISGRPTGVNPEATVLPSSTVLQLECAAGPQTLTNLNFPVSRDFAWSLANCGDTTLTISIGRTTLTRAWPGEKGFPRFLNDFRDGSVTYPASAFPDDAAALAEMGITRVDVNFALSGQQPVQRMLAGVPLDLPEHAAMCWGK